MPGHQRGDLPGRGDQLDVDAVVTDVAVEWGTATGSVKAALGVRFEPRLAIRSRRSMTAASWRATTPSRSATPAGWIGSVDASTGGWLVATSTSPVSLPEDVTTIAGTPGEPESSTTKATALVEALRSAAAARWDVPDRQTTQLVECASPPCSTPRLGGGQLSTSAPRRSPASSEMRCGSRHRTGSPATASWRSTTSARS